MSMQPIVDTAKAREYLVEQLREGTTLAKLALKKLDLSLGRFWAGFPADVDQLTIDFHHSLRGLQEEELLFARAVRAFVHSNGGVGFIADTESKSAIEIPASCPYKHCMLTYGDEVYWTIRPFLSELDIVKLLHAPLLPYPLVVFLSLSKVSGNGSELHYPDLVEVLRGLIGLAVAAFDTDSFLVWWRDDLISFPSLGVK